VDLGGSNGFPPVFVFLRAPPNLFAGAGIVHHPPANSSVRLFLCGPGLYLLTARQKKHGLFSSDWRGHNNCRRDMRLVCGTLDSAKGRLPRPGHSWRSLGRFRAIRHGKIRDAGATLRGGVTPWVSFLLLLLLAWRRPYLHTQGMENGASGCSLPGRALADMGPFGRRALWLSPI